jgi:hypothetical protein
MKVRILVAACAIAIGLAFAGQAQALDHFKCYKVKKVTTPFPPTANLVDQFSAVNAEIKKAFLWCNPVSKNGGLINDPADHLLCYKIKADKQEIQVSTTNQFGVSTVVAKKAFLMCVPGDKTL